MHIADVDKGMLGANGIVGGGPPLACGVGLSAKITRDRPGGGVLLRRRRLEPGHVPREPEHGRRLAPAGVFVFENNGYAESTSDRVTPSGVDIAERADGFGMPGVVVDGHDFFAVYEAAGAAIERARAGGGPTLLECKVNRYYGHFEGDQQTYRAPGRGDEPARDPRLPGGLRAAA